MAAIGPDRASCELATGKEEGSRDRSKEERGEHVVNQLASSQSTAKTMADEAPLSSSYCTLPRPARLSSRSDETERAGVLHHGQYYTLGRVGDRRTPQSPTDAVAMGQRMAKATGNASSGEEQPESTQRLLYEQNMCTFENFCERRNSEQRLQRAAESDPDTSIAGDTGGDGLGNFCTLRNGRRGWRSVTEGNNGKRPEGPHQALAGDYCTLKKKKFQLNRKFVESFLEDPNAQVADYLSELDAYLDEMDGVDDESGESDASDIHSTPDENDREGKEEEGLNSVVVDPAPVDPCSQSLQYYHPTPSAQGCADERGSERHGFLAGDYQDDRIRYGDIKHFCTLPKQKRTQFLNAFKRGTSLRRTVVVDTESERHVENPLASRIGIGCGRNAETGPPDNNVPANVSLYGQSGNDAPALDNQQQHHERLRRHHPSWHRNSMRKQHLIELPEQVEELTEGPLEAGPQSAVHDDQASGGSLGNLSDETNEYTSISTLPVGEIPAVSTPSEDMFIERHSALVVALPPSPVPPVDVEPIVHHTPALPPPLETDLDREEELVQARPRQTGRRALSQPRIGSITVERDEATNELIIRTSGVTETPPREDARAHYSTESTRHQQQTPASQTHQRHHRYGGAPESEEGSSLGSSRNPSPVSLLSTTTTYSSIASAAENAEDRHHQSMENTREGGENPGSSAGGSAQEVATITSASSANSRRNRMSTATEGQRRSGSAVVSGRATDASVPVGSSSTSTDDQLEDESELETARRSSRRNDGRPKARWPHAISRPLATTFCTLGLFNISRFAVFSVHFGANFVVQFLIFSLFFGIPMMWLQMVLGARIRGGPVTMWRVSPICKGIGIALLLAQALITLYSAISLAWVLVYFRDAFITHNEKYRWQERFEAYRGIGQGGNQSYRLPDTVADYFNGVVLQRYHLIYQPGPASPAFDTGGRVLPRAISGIGAIRFQLAFNMAIVWTLVFIALCRGIRSLGKVVIGLFIVALPALVAACAKLLTFINYDSVQSIFPATNWQEFFLNPISWTCAAQEAFLTWGLLGVSIYALNCRSNRKGSCNIRTRRELRRDAFVVAFVTLVGLLLAAVLGSACVQILSSRGYYYSPGSYEHLGTNVFLRSGGNQPIPSQHSTMNPSRWFVRYSTVVGESFRRTREESESGYQVLRLVTELLPAALAVASPERIQPIWGLLAYLALLLFGVGQLCVMWKPIAGAIGDAPSSILLSCVTGLLLGMPLATEGGINVVHYLDTILGAAWWLLLLWIGHILALFLVRGRPFTSDILVNDLQLLQSCSAFIAFAWNFLLPIGLIFLCIIQYRLSNSAALFNWPSTPSSNGPGQVGSYWPLWARQVGGFVQVSFLLLVPIVMVVQIYRYLCSGPPDILDRVDLLLRPPVDGDTSNPIRAIHSRRPAVSSAAQQTAANGTRNTSSAGQRDGSSSDRAVSLSLDSRGPRDAEDAPPKYTPPPSYTTATGARIAKMLRNSIRRSVRRIMGESSGTGATSGAMGYSRQRAALPQTTMEHCDLSQGANPSSGGELPPPDYCSVLQQLGGGPPVLEGAITALELARPPRALYNSSTLGSGRRYRSLIANADANASHEQQQIQPLTASDVRQILRPATIGGATAPPPLAPATAAGFTQTLRNTLLRRGHSMENLVLAAAPIGDSSIITLNCDDNDGEAVGDGNRRHRTGIGRDSVI
ncbi:sodium-dependent transporter bedraggled [Anopheles ziemanni]|uniref:sodium-dependent transporter bedraggled n=1 Tax=Anopheles ziemanni TaxID=345580 RepID=UPI00265F1992|nr:sodium-dependent transporter bedraggled [Anopheles ziemanni]